MTRTTTRKGQIMEDCMTSTTTRKRTDYGGLYDKDHNMEKDRS